MRWKFCGVFLPRRRRTSSSCTKIRIWCRFSSWHAIGRPAVAFCIRSQSEEVLLLRLYLIQTCFLDSWARREAASSWCLSAVTVYIIGHYEDFGQMLLLMHVLTGKRVRGEYTHVFRFSRMFPGVAHFTFDEPCSFTEGHCGSCAGCLLCPQQRGTLL